MAELSLNLPQRLLLGPGPSAVHPRVLQAGAQTTIGHLDPAFIEMMDELRGLLQYAFQTTYPATFVVSGPGSAGMEACLVNLLEPGDKAVVCRNGVFGGRMVEVVQRCGAHPVVLDSAWGQPVDLDALETTLERESDIKVVAFVHAETSTGVESDAAAISAIAQRHGCLSVADCVTSLGGIPLQVEDWGLDAVYSGSQKCLSCVPGLSPVTFSPRALDAIQQRKAPVQSWFLDVGLLTGYWGDGQRVYHHTAPINSLYSMYEALAMLQEEQLEPRWHRHRQAHQMLREGLQEHGLDYVVEESYRLPQLNAVYVPDGVDDAAVRQRLLQEHQIEIGGGLGPFAGKVWRIGLMGESARSEPVNRLLSALNKVLA